MQVGDTILLKAHKMTQAVKKNEERTKAKKSMTDLRRLCAVSAPTWGGCWDRLRNRNSRVNRFTFYFNLFLVMMRMIMTVRGRMVFIDLMAFVKSFLRSGSYKEIRPQM